MEIRALLDSVEFTLNTNIIKNLMKNNCQKSPITDEMYFQLMHDHVLPQLHLPFMYASDKLSSFSLVLGLACSW